MLVIDASVAVKFVTVEVGSDAADALVAGTETLIAPDWLLIEAASALWNKVKRSELLEIHAKDGLASLPAYFAKLYPAVDLLKSTYRLSFQLRHPVYDCLYLALAIEESATLITADSDFEKAIQRAGLGAHVLRLAV